ncbi:MAG: YggT family protein [Candidatus Doudnabacteria bacterium]|nr:YggT family protein [bacterium]MDZ4244281.1 YggT family protein [Candidatus Doudnabacteria bacterium]
MKNFTFLINFVFGLVEVVLGLRFILRLFGASAQAPFVNWVYDTSQPLLAPFRGIFPSPASIQGFVIEFTTLFAMLIYALIGYFLIRLLYFTHESTHHPEIHA